MFPPCDKMSLC